MYVNLLTPYVQSRIRARALLRRCCVLWLVFGLGIVACGTAKLWELRAAQGKLQRLSVHCQPLRQLEDAVQREQGALGRLQAELRRLQSVQPVNRHVAVLGVVLQAAQPAQGRLQVQKLSWNAAQPRLVPAASTANAARLTAASANSSATNASVSLQGVVDNDTVLAAFVAALQTSGVFQRVDLKSSSQIPDGNRVARQFQIECSYEERP